MKNKNTNDGKRQQRLFLMKVFTVFVLFWVQNFSGQLTISEGVTIYSQREIFVEEPPTDSHLEKDISQAKIYLSSDVKVSFFDSEVNYEIVRLSDSKKSIASKSAKTEITKKVVQKTDSLQPQSAHIFPKQEKTFTSVPESEEASSMHQARHTAVAHTQIHTIKLFINAGFTYFQIRVLDSTKTKKPVCLAQFHSKIHLDSYSVRPPPAQA